MSPLPPRAQALVNLWLASERLGTKIDHSLGAIHGIGYVELMVLLKLSAAHDDSMRRVDLASAIGRTASGVTRLLRPLEKIGLVERASSDRDARVSLVRITATGRERLEQALATLGELSERLLLPLGDATLDSMSAGLALLKEP